MGTGPHRSPVRRARAPPGCEDGRRRSPLTWSRPTRRRRDQVERLSGMDATFLYLETPAGHMHVAMTAIYDASTMDGGYDFDRIRSTIAERLPLVPPFRRRLVEVPFQFHHPVWIEDPDF